MLLTAAFFTVPFPNGLSHFLRYTNAIPMKPFIAVVTTSVKKQERQFRQVSITEVTCSHLRL